MSDELLKQLGLYVYILLFTKKKRNIKKEKGEAERIQHPTSVGGGAQEMKKSPSTQEDLLARARDPPNRRMRQEFWMAVTSGVPFLLSTSFFFLFGWMQQQRFFFFFKLRVYGRERNTRWLAIAIRAGLQHSLVVLWFLIHSLRAIVDAQKSKISTCPPFVLLCVFFFWGHAYKAQSSDYQPNEKWAPLGCSIQRASGSTGVGR